jgi:ABC-type glycerol-3-phosphate transport system substrate-binding protein
MRIVLGHWDPAAEFGDDPWGKFVEEKFNVDITFVDEDWSDYEQVIRLWAASDQLPDAFSGYPGTETWFPDLVRQGVLRAVPESMIAKYPNIKKVVDQTSLVNIMKDFLGGYYYLPRPESLSGLKKANNNGIYYRRDWAAKFGVTGVPADMETFYQLLSAYTNNDPDGNGRKDTYGYTASRLRSLYPPFGAFEGRWVNGPGGRAIPGYADEEPMVAALTWIRRAWKEGLIDTEFPQDYNVVGGKLNQGVYGAIDRSTGGWITGYAPPEYKDNPTKAVYWIGSMSDKPGGTLYHDIEPDSSGYSFKAGLSDEKTEKIIEIMNWLLSAEGYEYSVFGLPGVDFTKDSNGKITKTKEPNYASRRITSFPVWHFDASFDENASGDTAEVREAHLDYYNNPVWGANIGAVNALRDHVNLLATVTVTEERSLFPYSDYTTRDARLLEIISGDRDVRTMYREFIAECNNRGMQAMIDSVNTAMKK